MKLIKASIALVVAMIADAGVAYADSGQFVRYSCDLVCYYGVSSGNADSNTCGGSVTTKLRRCAWGDIVQHLCRRTLGAARLRARLPPVLDPSVAIQLAANCQAPVSLAAKRHYVHVGWSYASGAGSAANGYGRTQTP